MVLPQVPPGVRRGTFFIGAGATNLCLLGLPPQAPAPYPYWGSRPKPHRYAKPSREPTLLSLRDRLMAEEVPRSKRGKVTGRGGLSILGLTPQTPALREAIA